ncbi:MAG: hypothetical protein FWD67_11205 [Betaproteobacteria bacterium]|nr:hypothetical protein [Betaproteobacteria bacterium]
MSSKEYLELIKKIADSDTFKLANKIANSEAAKITAMAAKNIPRLIEDHEKAEEIVRDMEGMPLSEFLKKPSVNMRVLLSVVAKRRNKAETELEKQHKKELNKSFSDHQRELVNKKYDQVGGYHEKKNKVIEMWKSGKYVSKNQCAKFAAKALAISECTARNYLHNQ